MAGQQMEGIMEDQSQKDTDAGFIAYIFAHPDEFLTDLAVLASV